jgi:molecular chaperone GrpE
MTEATGLDEARKTNLIERFRRYLDDMDETPPPEPMAEEAAAGEAADLYTVFVELAALRNEVGRESRLMKDAFDQFRDVFQTVQSSQAALEQELQRAREREREQERVLLRPLLLDLLDLRDRLAAGLQNPPPPRAPWYGRWRRAEPQQEAWQEGLQMTLRRLDRLLHARRVTPIEMLGRRFDPRLGRVIATRDEAGVEAGIVLEQVRAGFLWEDALLRSAEVIVNKPASGDAP